MPVCEGCGSSYEDNFQFCPHCGRARPEPKKISIEVDISRKTAPDDCPLCGDGSQVQKVTAIVASGTSEANETSDMRGSTKLVNPVSGRKIAEGVTTGTSHSSSTQQNELARLLSKPRSPKKPSSKVWFPSIWIIVIVAIAVYYGMNNLVDEMPYITWTSDIFFFAACLVVFVLIIWGLTSMVNFLNKSKEKDRNAQQEYQVGLADYQAGLMAWNELYYCHKHDIVFIPGSKEYEVKEKSWQACVKWGQEISQST